MKQKNIVEIVRLHIKDLDEKSFSLDIPYTSKEELHKLKTSNEDEYEKARINNKKYRNFIIRIKESEIIRIVEKLGCTDSQEAYKGKYPFISDLIWIKIGKSYETYRELANRAGEDKGVITFNGVRYKNIICSSSNVRSQKALFILEPLFDKVNRILLCGIPEDQPYDIFAKYNSYYGLPSTDSIPVSLPNIVVIDDPKNPITEIFDIVEGELGSDEYTVKNNVEHKETIEFADGAGLVDVTRMQQWVDEINHTKTDDDKGYDLDYLPASVQFRAIPGIKGNLYTFDINAYAEKLKAENKPTIITDFWGKEWDFFEENIDCIMTVSQFKFAKLYAKLAEKSGDKRNGFNVWQKAFTQECEGYQRTFNISEISEPYRALKCSSILSYQPLQTLQFTDDEIKTLCAQMIKKFKTVNTDIDAFIKYSGIVDNEDGTINDDTPPFYQALANNHTLYNDPYIYGKITEDLKSLRHKCYSGKIIVDGNYQTLTPDLYALAQAAFKQEVTGFLKKGEVYSYYWNNRFYPFNTEDKQKWFENGVEEVDIIRNPHIGTEHCPARVVRNDDMDIWFQYQDTGIIFNIYDSFALRLNSADFDGDHILTTSSRILIDAAKRANIKTILNGVKPKEDKEDKENKNKDKPQLIPINNTSKIIDTNADGMKNSIGNVINKISILWSLPNCHEENIQDAIKIMSIIGSLTIDFAKTGIVAKIPESINRILKENGSTKPTWMKYLKKSDISGEETAESNIEMFSFDEDVKRKFTYRPDGTMQKISDYMKKQLQGVKVDFKDVEKKDRCLLDLIQNMVNPNNQTYKQLKGKLIDLQKDYCALNNNRYKDPEVDSKTKKEETDYRYKYFYDLCQDELLLIAKENNQLPHVLDYIIQIYATDEELISADQSILWNVFDSEMVERSKGIYNTKDFDIEKLEAKREKSLEKLDKAQKQKKQNNSVELSMTEKTANNFIRFSKGLKKEINFAKSKLADQRDAQRLYLILLGLFRKNDCQPVYFFSNKYSLGKDKKAEGYKCAVNKRQLSTLCGFSNDNRKVEKFIGLLNDSGLIVGKPIQGGRVIKLSVVIPPEECIDENFLDISDFAKAVDKALKNRKFLGKAK